MVLCPLAPVAPVQITVCEDPIGYTVFAAIVTVKGVLLATVTVALSKFVCPPFAALSLAVSLKIYDLVVEHKNSTGISSP